MFVKIAVFIREFVSFNHFIATLHPWHQAPIKRMPWDEKFVFRVGYAIACAENF